MLMEMGETMKLGVSGRAAGAAGLLLLGACGDVDNNMTVMVDQGQLCMFAEQPLVAMPGFEPETVSLQTGGRLHVNVRLPQCLSASCDVNRLASCDVQRAGSVLTVTSHISYEELDSEICTLDCGILSASCTSDELPAGAYTVVFGEQHFGLDVPSTIAPCR